MESTEKKQNIEDAKSVEITVKNTNVDPILAVSSKFDASQIKVPDMTAKSCCTSGLPCAAGCPKATSSAVTVQSSDSDEKLNRVFEMWQEMSGTPEDLKKFAKCFAGGCVSGCSKSRPTVTMKPDHVPNVELDKPAKDKIKFHDVKVGVSLPNNVEDPNSITEPVIVPEKNIIPYRVVEKKCSKCVIMGTSCTKSCPNLNSFKYDGFISPLIKDELPIEVSAEKLNVPEDDIICPKCATKLKTCQGKCSDFAEQPEEVQTLLPPRGDSIKPLQDFNEKPSPSAPTIDDKIDLGTPLHKGIGRPPGDLSAKDKDEKENVETLPLLQDDLTTPLQTYDEKPRSSGPTIEDANVAPLSHVEPGVAHNLLKPPGYNNPKDKTSSKIDNVGFDMKSGLEGPSAPPAAATTRRRGCTNCQALKGGQCGSNCPNMRKPMSLFDVLDYIKGIIFNTEKDRAGGCCMSVPEANKEKPVVLAGISPSIPEEPNIIPGVVDAHDTGQEKLEKNPEGETLDSDAGGALKCMAIGNDSSNHTPSVMQKNLEQVQSDMEDSGENLKPKTKSQCSKCKMKQCTATCPNLMEQSTAGSDFTFFDTWDEAIGAASLTSYDTMSSVEPKSTLYSESKKSTRDGSMLKSQETIVSEKELGCHRRKFDTCGSDHRTFISIEDDFYLLIASTFPGEPKCSSASSRHKKKDVTIIDPCHTSTPNSRKSLETDKNEKSKCSFGSNNVDISDVTTSPIIEPLFKTPCVPTNDETKEMSKAESYVISTNVNKFTEHQEPIEKNELNGHEVDTNEEPCVDTLRETVTSHEETSSNVSKEAAPAEPSVKSSYSTVASKASNCIKSVFSIKKE